MIGVLTRPEQVAAAREFFELFKTPWEPYRRGRRYDVVVATTGAVPKVDARLLVIYGPGAADCDARFGIEPTPRPGRASIASDAGRLPVHRTLATFAARPPARVCVSAGSAAAGLRLDSPDGRVIRLGYDLFDEVAFLLTDGQPAADAAAPSLDLHIAMLRQWILDAGIALVEIPPVASGGRFAVCLTHDIDFIGIRQHRFDHSMWGFLYRATLGAFGRFLRGRIGMARLLGAWRAAASLPFVLLGWARDFWEPFAWYLDVEQGLPVTYYLIPFKGRQGARVPGPAARLRATAYDVGDLGESVAALRASGCELGVHGIDAWHDAAKGREEREAIARVAGDAAEGVRMHWLLADANTPRTLEQAGYAYDSSCGYNETVGYRAGTTQVFRSIGVERLLELPVHVQDGALFYPGRLDLSETAAWARCSDLVANACRLGGVLTVLWHDRSHAPERFWGEFYVRLLESLRAAPSWFGTARQIAAWFRQRRAVRFERIGARAERLVLVHDGDPVEPPLTVRIHRPDAAAGHAFVDVAWSGHATLPIDLDDDGSPGVMRYGAPELCAL